MHTEVASCPGIPATKAHAKPCPGIHSKSTARYTSFVSPGCKFCDIYCLYAVKVVNKPSFIQVALTLSSLFNCIYTIKVPSISWRWKTSFFLMPKKLKNWLCFFYPLKHGSWSVKLGLISGQTCHWTFCQNSLLAFNLYINLYSCSEQVGNKNVGDTFTKETSCRECSYFQHRFSQLMKLPTDTQLKTFQNWYPNFTLLFFFLLWPICTQFGAFYISVNVNNSD